MSVSARNQLHGKVSAVRSGSVNDEIEITLDKGGQLVSVVTSNSRARLGLEKGKEVVALVKAPGLSLLLRIAAWCFLPAISTPARSPRLKGVR